jgi:hypothetical protein
VCVSFPLLSFLVIWEGSFRPLLRGILSENKRLFYATKTKDFFKYRKYFETAQGFSKEIVAGKDKN